MNELDGLLRGVESDQFSAMVNVASNLKTFLRALGSLPEAEQLARAMHGEEVRRAVCERALRLAAEEVDGACEHPRDAAVAAYLYLLSRSDESLARRAAVGIDPRGRWWWARKVADQVAPAAIPRPGAAPAPTPQPDTPGHVNR